MRTSFLTLTIFLSLGVQAAAVPLYLPYSRAPEPTDITVNAYGASRLAPEAFGIGEIAPDFDLPLSRIEGGEERFSLDEAAAKGPVAIIFYRGHW